MQIRIDEHAKERATERGASEEEIDDTLKTGTVITAKGNKLAKEKVYKFNQERNGKVYKEKQVKVVYIIEQNTTVVITVVVKYGNFTKT